MVPGSTTTPVGQLIDVEQYTIDLDTDTEGLILIDASVGADHILVDADIPAEFLIRGGDGDDLTRLNGAVVNRIRGFEFLGEGGNDTFELNRLDGDPIPAAGYELAFDGGRGNNNAYVRERNSLNVVETPPAYFVNTLLDAADADLSDNVVDSVTDIDDGDHLQTLGQQISLRAAVQAANAASGSAYVFLPEGQYNLTRTGAESLNDANVNDLDITGEMTIVGAGAGLSVIDAGGFASLNGDTRPFQVQTGGDLEVSRLTVTGGDVDDSPGGAFNVQGNSTLTLTEAAVVGNRTISGANGLGAGGAIFAEGSGTQVTITDSVITDNEANGYGGVRLNGSAPALTIEGSVIAGNRTLQSNPLWGDDLALAGGSADVNNGNNLLGVVTGAASGFFSTSKGDTVGGTPDFIVTSVADRIDSADDAYALSLREAVIKGNDVVNDRAGLFGPFPPIETWLPPWYYLLTIDGEGEDDSLTGDLDIFDDGYGRSLESAGPTTVNGSLYATDSAFELFGSVAIDSDITTI